MKYLILGFLVGLLMGFIDTYGYAVTGYTTAELSPVTSSILIYALHLVIFRRKIPLLEHFLATLIATGFSLTTTITSGMYVTYTMLSRVSDPKSIGLPHWTYFKGFIDLNTLLFYLFATSVTVSGVLIAYAFHRHFIEREKLPFPIGIALTLTVSVVRLLKSKNVVIPILIGFTLELMFLTISPSSIDLTPMIQTVFPGTSLALSLDVMVFLIALLIPLNTSLGVGLGNAVMYTLITSYLVYLGLYSPLPAITAQELAVSVSPLTASILVGSIISATTFYMVQERKLYTSTIKYLIMAKYELKRLAVAVIILSSTLIPPIMVSPYMLNPITILVAILLVPLYIFITLMTVRATGETGTTSQSTLPLITLTLFSSGYRGAAPYIFLDPYTGVPMPQFVAGTSTAMSKSAKLLGVDVELTSYLLAISMLVSAPITLMYGHLLLSIYGVESTKFNLIRWLPTVTWMKSIYSGDLSAFYFEGVLIGIIVSLSFVLLTRFTKLGISIFSIMLGITLTPDVALLFITASLIKYLALRLGSEVYEYLLVNVSLALAGCGLAVATYTMLSFMSVV
ncbi:MAG: hypothetical protein RMH77_06425 [Sulfolobales archaeon]|nr:hypothetical protein [Sulfolobales archaeon]MDW7970017.1 hypothetical protein [Sulfolobales archaeon]